jgi:hypothetical protein
MQQGQEKTKELLESICYSVTDSLNVEWKNLKITINASDTQEDVSNLDLKVVYENDSGWSDLQMDLMNAGRILSMARQLREVVGDQATQKVHSWSTLTIEINTEGKMKTEFEYPDNN